MKARIILLLIGAVAVAIYIMRPRSVVDDGLQGPDRHEQARREVLESCTNEVPGIARILEVNYGDTGSDAAEWKASAIVERVNEVGGMERTNLYFRFERFGSGIICLPDHEVSARL